MPNLPPGILDSLRPATTREIRSWSFGALEAPRAPGASRSDLRGSLDDQAIFGPVYDFRCSCGKYEGERFSNMICDHCGVKVASSEIRRFRFGHIELSTSVVHPFSIEGECLDAFPVLPARLTGSIGGTNLAVLYDNLIRAKDSTPTQITDVIDSICEALLPPVIHAHEWDLQDLSILARGLALLRKSASPDGRCNACGYPLAGIDGSTCPGCGRRIEPS